MKDEKNIITEKADQKESKFGFERLEKAEISQELKEQAEGKYRNLRVRQKILCKRLSTNSRISHLQCA